jgi:hypothetical protein
MTRVGEAIQYFDINGSHTEAAEAAEERGMKENDSHPPSVIRSAGAKFRPVSPPKS